MCGFPGAQAQLDLCEHCKRMLPANDVAAWDYPAVFSRALVPFQYSYPVDRFIRALKFKGERLYARVLGMLLAEAQRMSGAPLPQLLIPVPLHSSRYRERGFNQAHQIARFVGKELKARVDVRILKRVVATKEQSSLSLAGRSRNVRGAFRAASLLKIQHVALVDDVLTTGNTAAEAAGALVKAGIEKVEIWAVARVLAMEDRKAHA
jgi:ComF family protein